MSNTVTWIIKAQDQFTKVAKDVNQNIVMITNNIYKAAAASKAMDGSLNKALAKMEERSVAAKVSINELGHSLLTLAAPLGVVGISALHAASKYQQLQVAFTSMTGSTKAAKEELATIQKFARISPFTFFDVARSEKLLRQSHVGKKSIFHLMGNIGDISAGAGLPLQRLATTVASITGKGWITNAEVRQLRAYHIDILRDLAKKTGRTMQDVFQDIRKRQVPAAIVLADFDKYTSKGGIFYKQMERQFDTLGGSFNKMKEGLEVSGFSFGLWMDRVFGIAHKMKTIGFFLQDTVMPFFNTIHKNHPVLEQLLKWFVGLTAAILIFTPILLALEKIYKAWAIVARLAGVAQWALNIAMAANPISLLISLIAAAAVGFYMFLNYTKQGQAILKAFEVVGTAAFHAVANAIKDAWHYAEKLFDKIKSVNLHNIWGGIKSEVGSLSMHIPFMNHNKTDVNINIKDDKDVVKSVTTNSSKNANTKVNKLGKNMVTS